MTVETFAWRRTGERCKRGHLIEVRTVRVHFLQGHDDETERRCCRECEGDD
jgi:hypothetical protein